jgi:hypothetical protein
MSTCRLPTNLVNSNKMRGWLLAVPDSQSTGYAARYVDTLSDPLCLVQHIKGRATRPEDVLAGCVCVEQGL